MAKRSKQGPPRSSFISLPVCVLIFFVISVIFRSLSAFKQSEDETKLREEVKALSEEFGLDFSVTLAELVRRGIISPHLAANLIRGEGKSESEVHLFLSSGPDEIDESEETEQTLNDEKENEEIRAQSKRATDGPITDREFFENSELWMKPGVKYFVYQSSGGLSNQRIILESALVIGRLLNRTVVVPGMGPHTSMWYNFNKVPLEDFLPADELFDGPRMRKIASILPIRGVTLKRFIAMNEDSKTWHRIERNKLAEKRLNPWKMDFLKESFGNVKEPVLFFARGTMWECFDFPEDILNEARRAVRAHANIRRVAYDVSHRLFPKGFNSLHIRFMDNDGTDLREGLLKPAASFVYRMRKFDKDLPLYVATVPNRRRSPYFNPFTKQFKELVFGDVLENDDQVKMILSKTTKKMKETVLGLIEQLVCARAEKFLGTGFSTFSEHIRRMRRWRELTAIEDLTDPKKIAEEQRFLSQITPCTNPLYPC